VWNGNFSNGAFFKLSFKADFWLFFFNGALYGDTVICSSEFLSILKRFSLPDTGLHYFILVLLTNIVNVFFEK